MSETTNVTNMENQEEVKTGLMTKVKEKAGKVSVKKVIKTGLILTLAGAVGYGLGKKSGKSNSGDTSDYIDCDYTEINSDAE